jgi:hypothetical protein
MQQRIKDILVLGHNLYAHDIYKKAKPVIANTAILHTFSTAIISLVEKVCKSSL